MYSIRSRPATPGMTMPRRGQGRPATRRSYNEMLARTHALHRPNRALHLLAPAPVGRWDIGAASLDTGGEQTISNNTTDATNPAIDGNVIVWQQVAPNGDLDVYGNVCTASYSDVLPTDYFYTPVQWLACRGVLSGYAD